MASARVSDEEAADGRAHAEEGWQWRSVSKTTGRTVSKAESQDEERAPERRGMFIDSARMKEKLRQNMIKPEYDVTNFYKKQGFCQMVARSTVFEHTTLTVIAFNALWMAIDTDLNKAAMLLTAHPVFQIVEQFFCVYFTFEWTIRFGAFKKKRSGLRDPWFVFDSFMVFMMVSETWVMSIVLIAAGVVSGGGGLGNASILRLLRLLRLSRMARMAKLLRSMPELLILIKGMLQAMKSVIYTLVLLGLLLYVFAIALRQLTEGTPVGTAYFSGIIRSMHTLLIDGTLMDNPGTVVAALLEESVVYVVIFYIFVCLAALMVMNMLIGVLCEVVSAVAATERETIAVATVKDGFMDIIDKGGLDTDGNQMISRSEFEAIMDNPDATRLLEAVNVDVYGLVDLADFIFAQEYGEQEEKQLKFPEFMEIVLSLRGTNTATVKDIVDLRKFIKGAIAHLEDNLPLPSKKSIAKEEASSPQSAQEKLVNRCRLLWEEGNSAKSFARCKSKTIEDVVPNENEQALALIPGVPPGHFEEPMNNSTNNKAAVLHAVPSLESLNQLGLQEPRCGITCATSSIPRDITLQAYRLEGVLISARNEVSRFLDGLPSTDAYSEAASGSGEGNGKDNRPGINWQLLPAEVRELMDLRLRMSRLVQALADGLDDLQAVQQSM